MKEWIQMKPMNGLHGPTCDLSILFIYLLIFHIQKPWQCTKFEPELLVHKIWSDPLKSGASFQLLLEGGEFFLFFNATGLLKNCEKQHFICSNLTLFIVPFFLFFFFYLFSFLLFFLYFPGGGAMAPSPPQMTPLAQIYVCMAPYIQLQL